MNKILRKGKNSLPGQNRHPGDPSPAESDVPARLFKGLLMGLLFGGFLLGILALLWVVVPVCSLLDRFLGEKARLERAVRAMFGWWLRLLATGGLIRAEPVRGAPFDGPCVVVSNHPGLFDVVFLIREIPNLSVLVKSSLPRRLPLRPLLRTLGYVMAADFQKVTPMDVAEDAMTQIRSGKKLQIFPEGTRSPADGLRPFRPGAFKIARMTGAAVQPVLIRNVPPFLPKGARWYYPPREISTIRMEFWDPLNPPIKGGEREFAQRLERRFREALGLKSGGPEDMAPDRRRGNETSVPRHPPPASLETCAGGEWGTSGAERQREG